MNTFPPPLDNGTKITDIDIPFGRLIVIMLKFMLASIPAVLCMYAIMGAIALLAMGVIGGFAGLSQKLLH